MDYIQENILPSLRTYSAILFQKSASTFSLSSSHLTRDQITTTIQTEYLEPYILQPLSAMLDLFSSSSSSSSSFSSSNLVSAIILLLTLYISLRVLDYARRVVMFWVTLVMRLIFWAAVISIAVYVYNVGPEKAIADAGWIWGVVQGFVEDFVVAANTADADWGRRKANNGYAGNSPQYWYRGAP